MTRALLPLLASSLLLLTSAVGCDAKKEASGEQAADERAQGSAPNATNPAGSAEQAEPPAEAAAAPTLAAIAPKDDTVGLGHLAHEKGHIEEGADAGDAAKKDAPHIALDEAGKDGALAHAASALAHTDAIPAGHGKDELLQIAGEDEISPTDKEICEHLTAVVFAELEKEAGEPLDPEVKKDTEKEIMADCPKEAARERAKLGPHAFQQVADCMMKAETIAAVDACAAAEEEAEEELHAHPTGDGLSLEVCSEFYEHFISLATAEFGEDDMVKEAMEDLKEDIIQACIDHGTQAEIDCGTKAEKLDDLEACGDGGD